MSNAPAVTDATFSTEVLESDQPVLVDFWATWCPPCRQVAPIIDELAAQYSGRVKVVKVDTDENQNVAMRYGIMSIPTFLLFKGGQVVHSMSGARPKADFVKALEAHVEPAVTDAPVEPAPTDA